MQVIRDHLRLVAPRFACRDVSESQTLTFIPESFHHD